jgi:hypothetical protein
MAMTPEQLQYLLAPQQPQNNQPSPADIMAAISSKNPMAAVSAMQAPQLAQQFGQQFKGMIGGITGKTPMNAAEAYKVGLQNIIQNNPDALNTSAGLTSAAQLAGQTGNQQQAMQFATMASQLKAEEAAKAKEAQLRSTLAQTAVNLGLTTEATMLESGGDVDAAAKSISDEEKRVALARGGRSAKVALANQVQAGPAMLAQIMAGEYDATSATEFASILEGNDAELKAFATTSGGSAIYKTSKFGRVYDEANGVWVNPGDLGLKPAVLEQRTQTVMDNFGARLWDGEADTFLARGVLAEDAVNNLQLVDEAVGMLDAGIKSGAYANFRVGLVKSLQQMGLVSKTGTEAEQIANTEAYVSRAAERVATAIKAFGAGTGLSDADREYAQQMVAGDIAMNEESMRRVLAMDAVSSRSVIADFNSTIDKYQAAGIGGNNLDIFRKRASLAPVEMQGATKIGKDNLTGNKIYLIRDKWFRPDGSEVQ